MAEENGCDSCGTKIDRLGDHSYVVCGNCLSKATEPEDWDEAIYKVRIAFETLEKYAAPERMVMINEYKRFLETWQEFKKAADEFLVAYYG